MDIVALQLLPELQPLEAGPGLAICSRTCTESCTITCGKSCTVTAYVIA